MNEPESPEAAEKRIAKQEMRIFLRCGLAFLLGAGLLFVFGAQLKRSILILFGAVVLLCALGAIVSGGGIYARLRDKRRRSRLAG